MSVCILGVSALYHDSAAALIVDGDILAAAQEERFTRRKHDDRFPRRAISFCLKEACLRVQDVDYVVFYEKPLVKFDRILETHIAVAPHSFNSFRKALPLWAKRKLRMPEVIKGELGDTFRGDILFTEHHESHAASAFFPSPFEEAAILTLDAVGEWATSTIGVGRGNSIELSREMRFPHSLGMLYSAVTHYAGFKVNSGEYKLMGLAPYGEPVYVDVIRDELIELRDDGSLWLNMDYFSYGHGQTMSSPKFHRLFGGPPRKSESLLTQREMDLAASIQVVTDDAVLAAARHAQAITGSRNLTMAGGVALNCVANGRLLRQGPFEEIWVQPAAGDAGGALGAALQVWYQHLDNARTPQPRDSQRGSLLGPAFTNHEIAYYLAYAGAAFETIDDEAELVDRVARLMAREKVVGWFHGRMEFGPRALGARSIIGDARSPRMQQIMNLKIKFRESFRPFAPCVLRDHVHTVFEAREGEDSPYMLFTAPVREALRAQLDEDARERMTSSDLRIRVSVPRSTLPAITHVDYSARIQTVDRERHGRYARLIERFYELTGVPVIINTSFNIRGEPIVASPEDAFRCFMATKMDVLVLENHLLLKEDQPEELNEDSDAYRAQYDLD